MSRLDKFVREARRLLRDRRGNVAVISALMMPVLMGSFGLGTEVASWYANQRAMQNAADSAALAAASNASGSYATEAKAVTAQYGFVDGSNGVTVSASNTAACPAGGANCYSVTISKSLPLILTQFVGYSGDATVGGAPAKRIRATAVATQATVQRDYCLVALGNSGNTITSNGAPNANLAGCDVMSNGSSVCNGHDLQADIGDAHVTNNGCGVVQNSNIPSLTDPYAYLSSNIPSDTCGGTYPQEPAKKGTPLPSTNLFAGNYSWTGVHRVCGDMQLTGPMTIDTSGGSAVLVIYNGQLDTNGYTLQTTAQSGLTIIFAGSNGAYTHAPTGGGTLDFAAPTSGTWSGMAIYQDPALTSGVDISAAGNSPTWDISGAVYLPHSSVTFSGAVNKSSNGQSCFVMVMHDVTINGTGSILAHGGCGSAGLIMPSNEVPGRAQLVS